MTRGTLSFAVSAVLCVSAAGAQRIAFAPVKDARPLPNGVELHAGPLVMQITALRDDVVRIRAGNGALPEGASWAVLAEAREASAHTTPSNTAATAGFETAALRVAVDRVTGCITLYDKQGNLLAKDASPVTWEGHRVELARAMPAEEHDFGLGDKTGAFDRRGSAFRMWNTDAYAWQESTDPLYKDIPFFLSYRAGVTLGTLIDNTWPSTFDFGKTVDGQFRYSAENGPVDVYLLYGPDAKHVLGEYAWLTGPTPLAPLWALGFQQSRYSYMTAQRVEEVAARMRADRIPSDALYLDIDYQQKNRPFTIDTTAFPDMAGLVRKLHDEHFHVVAITDMHIASLPNAGYAPYDSGIAGDHFVKGADGKPFVGPVWPGPSVFPDFTREVTRAWWGTLYRPLDSMGLDGFWNDMNEPSVFVPHLTMPDEAVHRIEGDGFRARTAPHREIHNIYGLENSRATYEGQLALRPNVRPFVLTRASYAGGQRYAATWTGDNSATWNHLRLTTPMLKNLGLSGFSLAGADVGGYAGTPSAELLTKWLEIAAFQPIDRDHAEKGTGDHEVWANGPEQEAVRRRFIEERYRLLPYLYTTAEENTRTGLPLLRPIFLEFPDATPDKHPLDIDLDASGEFMVGRDLLVAPPPFPDKTDDYDAKLPSNGWYDYWTGKRVSTGDARSTAVPLQPESNKGPVVTAVRVHPELNALPVFVRPGSILPIAPVVQSTEDTPQGPLTLRVFPGDHCAGSLYVDDGKTFAYRKGEVLRMRFTCSVDLANGEVRVHLSAHSGTFAAWWKAIRVEINGVDRPMQAYVNGQPAKSVADGERITVEVPDGGHGAEISVR